MEIREKAVIIAFLDRYIKDKKEEAKRIKRN